MLMKLYALLLAANLPFASCSNPVTKNLFSPLINTKVRTVAANESHPPLYPQYTDSKVGDWKYFDPNKTWTTGFFPATLYALYTRKILCPSIDNTTDWLGLARTWSTGIVPYELVNDLQHDVGFVSFPFQEELLVNPNNATAIIAVNDFAADLAARYNPVVGCTRSWDTSDSTDFQVIIDNMMNLEILFRSEELTGNRTLRKIAMNHADHTMENHIRDDGSSFHVVEYNSTTGVVIKRRTSQGYADNSTWTRGQAWGIYGFSLMYANTGLPRYLDTARRMATFFYNNIPEDGIVPWDFNAPLTPPRPADSSAATIAATGFLLLSQLELTLIPPNISGSNFWAGASIDLLNNVTNLAWKPDWQSILANGTVNNVANPPNNLTGIVYGDYFYVKAGNELVLMGLATCD